MADLDSIIASSVSDAREAGTLEAAPVESDSTTDLESGDSSVESEGEVAAEVVEGTEGEAEVKVEAPPVVAEEEEKKVEEPLVLADDELGPAKDKKGKENRIPHSRVQKIVAKATEKAVAPYKQQVTDMTATMQDQDARLTRVGELEHIMFEEQPRFLEILQTLPGYKELLSGKIAPKAVDPESEEPKPDLDLGDGKFTYSPEGLEKRLAWRDAQTRKSVLAELKPMRDAFEGEQRTRQMVPVVQAQLQEASQWEGFNDSQADILAALKTDRESQAKLGKPPKLTLERAYLQVMMPKFKADKAKIRAEILAELKKAPVSTGVVPGQKKAVVDDGAPKSIEQIIKNSIKGLKNV